MHGQFFDVQCRPSQEREFVAMPFEPVIGFQAGEQQEAAAVVGVAGRRGALAAEMGADLVDAMGQGLAAEQGVAREAFEDDKAGDGTAATLGICPEPRPSRKRNGDCRSRMASSERSVRL